jgi:hypothetical protein
MLKRVLKKECQRVQTGCVKLGIAAGSSEYDKQSLGSIKCGEFIH